MRLKIKYKIFKGKVIAGYIVQQEGLTKSQIISRENILKFSDYFEGVSFTRDGLIRKAVYPIDKCSFDQVNGLLAKTDISIDLNKYKNNKLYDGNARKFGVTINGQDFIVKFSKTPSDTSVFSEYVASNFICNLGFSAHITKLVKYNGEIAVLIKDFTTASMKLRSFKDTSQSSEDTNLADKAYSYEDVLYLIEKHKKMNNISKQEAIQYFWQMYVLDAILANWDRHHGNWGYLTTQNGYAFAPIYDNGSSLFPEISKKIQEYSKDRFTFLQERAERFPASLLMQYSESERRYKRTNYNAVINSNQYSDLTKQVNLFRSFGVNKVYAAIRKSAANSLIPVIYQQFYVDIVCMRYLHIIQGCPMAESFEILTKLARGEKSMNERAMRIEHIDRIRKAYIMWEDTAVASIYHEYSSLSGEFDWVIRPNWKNWQDCENRGWFAGIAGIDETLHKEEYIRRYDPYFVTQRTLSSVRPDLYELLESIQLNYNDLFEVMCRTHGVCGNDDLYVSRTPDKIVNVHQRIVPYDIPDFDTSNYGWLDRGYYTYEDDGWRKYYSD